MRSFLAICFLALLAPAAAWSDDLIDAEVRSITVVGEDGSVWEEADSLLPLLDLRPGDRLSREAVRRSIANVYLKRRFRDVRAEAYPEDSGAALVIRLFPVTVIDKILLRGNHSLPDRVLQDAMKGLVGKELREEHFPDIRVNLQTLYQAEGFYNVRVNFRTEPAQRPYGALLYVYVTEPRRTVIEQVRFTGNTALSDRELLAKMRNRPGEPLLTEALLEEDLPALQQLYAAAGYPASHPGPVSMSFKDDRVFLEIAGQEGPRVATTFSGNRLFSDRQLAGMLLIAQEHELSDTVIESSAEKVRNAYRDEGYPDVKVEWKRTERPRQTDLYFAVTEGGRVTVASVVIEGDRGVPADDLLGQLETRGARWYRRNLPFREDVVEKDRDLILDRYAAAGYLDAEVRVTVTRGPDGRTARVLYKVTEGKRTLVGSVSFEGISVFPPAELLASLALRPGMPFSERLVEEDRYRLLTRYAAKGYLYTRVDLERHPATAGTGEPLQPAAGEERLDLVYRVTEDRQVTIGRVILRGNAYTRDRVILRELEPGTGEPYSYEKVLQSQQRIYHYGYFSQARFEPVKPFEKTSRRDMLFTVEERPAGAVEFGVGYGDLDRLRGFAEVSHRNLWGTARYASIRMEGSDILKRTALTFKEPWFAGHRLESQLTLAWSDRKNINQDTREINYQTRKTTATWGVDKVINTLKLSLAYQFENVDNYNVNPAATLSYEDSGRVLISSLNPAFVWDLRDDPFNPGKGSIHGVVVKEALKELGSEAKFTKASVQSSWFLSLRERTVLALSGRAGMAWPHQDTTVVPIHERFYLGGSTTVRGFTQDSVGPYLIDVKGNRVPTGGSSMVQLNGELRLNGTGGGGIVLFTDAGNVWVDKKIRMDELRASYGLGLRYQTPVGPLRIDYGQKIHRRSGESPGELHFNIGHAF